ncbi:sodium:glutamate symporter [Nocardiopsis sp. RSe5-2]|uniref:Sodium:glutamate symporter n=1 Tax=Nocardiopsis endophytica TaxID=3018445 RepID=A0ABT4U3Z8_9ACTN|nr:sodium:glutamate symporter [Nocardiopsis endophytica]MDA2811682.1 sodium:glutamate symporter [Nocardiopsis endophytica]
MSPDTIGLALLLLGVLLLVAKLVRVKWKLTQKLFLPSSIIGGGIALLLGPDIFGRAMTLVDVDSFTEGGLFGAGVYEVWSALPGLLISVVFAGLFLGKPLPRFKDAARLAGPQLAFGLTLSTGQYVIGLLLALLVLVPVFNLPALTGALIEIGFVGGHGTAAGLGDTFDKAGFPEGQDLAVGMATVGLLAGILLGIALINWGVRRRKTVVLDSKAEISDAEQAGLLVGEKRGPGAMLTVHPSSLDPLALHFGLIAIAVLIGQLILSGMQAVEQALWADTIEIFEYVPLFPLAMIGGILLQILIDRFDKNAIVDSMMIERVQGFSLDMLIISAMATLSLQVLAENLLPFLLLAAAGILWVVGAFLFLAPRMMPSHWFERGIGDFGQSLGVTATGLVLMRIVDPELKTPAYPAFGYKQLVFEPFFGGGLVTAAAIPLIISPHVGAVPFLIIMAVGLAISLYMGLFVFGRKRRAGAAAPAQESASVES